MLKVSNYFHGLEININIFQNEMCESNSFELSDRHIIFKNDIRINIVLEENKTDIKYDQHEF